MSKENNYVPKIESARQSELTSLYRPLDREDKGWMTALGCNWPNNKKKGLNCLVNSIDL